MLSLAKFALICDKNVFYFFFTFSGNRSSLVAMQTVLEQDLVSNSEKEEKNFYAQ